MRIDLNTTVIDVAFNLYGSLTGIPAILRQLPVGERIGFDTLPDVGRDVADIGQTWTPDLQGKDVPLVVEKIYNTLGQAKAPYTTDLYALQGAISRGEDAIRLIIDPPPPPRATTLVELKVGDDLTGTTIQFLDTDLPMPTGLSGEGSEVLTLSNGMMLVSRYDDTGVIYVISDYGSVQLYVDSWLDTSPIVLPNAGKITVTKNTLNASADPAFWGFNNTKIIYP